MNTAVRPFEYTFEEIPNYERYPSVKELQQHSYELEQRYPDLVTVETIGTSQAGVPLVLDKINDQNDPGQPKALFVGSVHANEVVGGLTTLHTEEAFCASPDLRQSLGDCALWMVKTIDPDGYSAQKWLSEDSMTPLAYISGVFRQAKLEQASWGFETYAKDGSATPEVMALAGVIQACKPDFYYTLHNGSFGSGYFLATDNYPQLNSGLRQELLDVGLVGQTITEPGYTQLAAGIGQYDVKPFLPHNHVNDMDYARAQNRHCFSLVPEVPYFTADIFNELEVGTYTAGEVRAQFASRLTEARKVLQPIIERYAAEDSVYARAAVDKLPMLTEGRHAPLDNLYNGSLVSNAEFARCSILSLYRLGYAGLIRHVAETKGDTSSVQAIHELTERHVSEVEQFVPLRPVPIRNLVQAQARAGLRAMRTHFDTLAEKS